jgi:hypothetical protein
MLQDGGSGVRPSQNGVSGGRSQDGGGGEAVRERKRRVDAECTHALRCEAGVGVEDQRATLGCRTYPYVACGNDDGARRRREQCAGAKCTYTLQRWWS